MSPTLSLLTRQRCYQAVTVACVLLLAFGLYLEHQLGLEPCPLCIVQRVLFLLVMAAAAGAAWQRPDSLGERLWAAGLTLSATIGAASAARQLWLQNLPPTEVPPCAPGLNYMLEVLPLRDILPLLLAGDGSCAEVQWRFGGLSIPAWSLLAFAACALCGIIGMLRLAPKATNV